MRWVWSFVSVQFSVYHILSHRLVPSSLEQKITSLVKLNLNFKYKQSELQTWNQRKSSIIPAKYSFCCAWDCFRRKRLIGYIIIPRSSRPTSCNEESLSGSVTNATKIFKEKLALRCCNSRRGSDLISVESSQRNQTSVFFIVYAWHSNGITAAWTCKLFVMFPVCRLIRYVYWIYFFWCYK